MDACGGDEIDGRGGGGGGGDATLRQRNPHVFTKGSTVEVLAVGQDYGGVFFTATVIGPSLSPRKCAKKKLHVQYHKLLAQEVGSDPLLEYVDVSMVRPEPPPSHERAEGFELGEMVDAFFNDGWWAGIVARLVDGGDEESGRRFVVNFHHPPDVREFGASDLRPHLDWVDGAWVKPEKQVIQGSDNGVLVLDQAFRKSPHTESLMKNQPEKLTYRRRSQVTKGNDTPQSRVTSPPLGKRKTMTTEVLSDLKSEDISLDIPSRRRPIRKKQSPVGAKEVNEKMNSLSATSMSKNSEKLLLPQITEDVIEGPGKKCLSQDVRNKRARNDYELPLIICLPFDDKVTPTSGKSRAEKDKKSSGIGRGRGRPRNPSNALHSPMNGNAKNGIASHKLLNKDQDNLEASGEQTKDKNCNGVTEEIPTKEPNSKATNNLSLAISMKEIQPPPTVAVKNVELLQEGTGNSLENNQHSYAHFPFVSIHSLWKAIESMEVFKSSPQMPHFTPLDKFPEYSREGLAIGLMLTFTKVAEKSSNLRLSDPESTIVEILSTLAELESHGFDIAVVRDRVRSFVLKKEEHRGYEEEVKKLKKDILQHRNDKARICGEIAEMNTQMQKLQEMISRAEEAGGKADEEIVSLESKIREAEEAANNGGEGRFL